MYNEQAIMINWFKTIK